MNRDPKTGFQRVRGLFSWARQSVFRLIPRPVKNILKGFLLRLADAGQRRRRRVLFGEKARFVAPLWIINDGPRDYGIFRRNGDEFFNIFTGQCGLKNTDRIFDIGCGAGRKTIPLLDFVDPGSGGYDGLDVYQPHVDWCRKTMQAEYPHFRFHFKDIWSKLYNPTGRLKAAEVRFPFSDASFDFIIMGSVFTHLFMDDTAHYISEIGRVTRRGARGMVSFFLLNPESEKLIGEGRSEVNLVHDDGSGCKADNAERYESAVGHDERKIRTLFAAQGFDARPFYGSWCGRKDFLSYQDVVRIEKVR